MILLGDLVDESLGVFHPPFSEPLENRRGDHLSAPLEKKISVIEIDFMSDVESIDQGELPLEIFCGVQVEVEKACALLQCFESQCVAGEITLEFVLPLDLFLLFIFLE